MEGDEVFFIEEGKDKWSRLAKVTGQEGLKVRIIHAGYDRTLPACRVIPRCPEKLIVEKASENSQGMGNVKIISILFWFTGKAGSLGLTVGNYIF